MSMSNPHPRRGPRAGQLLAWVLASCLAASGQAAQGEGLDLNDPTPRRVDVRFEASGPKRPGALDGTYDAPVKAWFSHGPEAGQAQVRISGADMERVITNYEPVPGSFSDFVWTFDVATGHVIKAELEGVVTSRVDWGFFETEVETSIAMDLGTRKRAGFREPKQRFGHLIFEYCEEKAPECRSVPPAALDPSTGYVNAVGAVTATAVGGLETMSYSPMGEAMIEEAAEMPHVSVGP